MEKGKIYCNHVLAGILTKHTSKQYVFQYDDVYYADPKMKAISLTLPKTKQSYISDQLFTFFSGLLTEGINKNIQCKLLKIDENDDFSRLLKTAGEDTIGAITVREVR